MSAECKGVEDEASIEPQNLHNTGFLQQAGVLGTIGILEIFR